MFLKRIIRLIAALTLSSILLSTGGFGQTRKHDVSLQAGFLSIDQLSDMFTDILTVVISIGAFTKEDMEHTGVPFLTYHYSANSRFGFGAAFGGYASSGILQTGGIDAGTFKERSYVGGVELDYHWLMREGFQLYSGAGFGIRFRRGIYQTTETDTLNRFLPAFHVNAIGVRLGRKVGFFAELGAGYKGVFSAGVNAQF